MIQRFNSSRGSDELHRFKDPHVEAALTQRRIALASFLVSLLFGLLFWRFYSLQVVYYEDYAEQADSNRIIVRPVPPNRGLIYDRHGALLADNRPTFTLSLVKERVPDLPATLAHIAGLIDVSDNDRETFAELLKQRRRPFQPVPLRFRLSQEEIAAVAVDEYQLEGVIIQADLTRFYPQGALFAHVLGYVGRINERELQSFSERDFLRYAGTNSIGKVGIEKYYEKLLLGQPGDEHVEANAHGRVIKTLKRVDPKPGKDLHLYLDADLQQAALDAMGDYRGSVVVLEIASGGVLAMVSNPGYDPNLFVTGISYEDYDRLNQSKDLPLFNRAVQGQYPPGSTIKPILGLGALQEGVVTPETTIADPGFYQLENDERLYRDWKRQGHGQRVDLLQAIVESCDTFFYGMAVNMGVDRLHPVGAQFGLGEKTGIDIPNERAGIWPSRQWKREHRGLPWFPGDSLNISIGQGDVLSTPLQMATMTAAFATEGKRIKPQLVARTGDTPRKIEEEEGYVANAENWRYVKYAMDQVVHGRRGTARAISRKLNYHIAGKTGTAQVVGIAQDEEYDAEKLSERNRDHALFIAYAPADDPKIALAVIAENGGSGSGTAAPIARKVIDAYMNSE